MIHSQERPRRVTTRETRCINWRLQAEAFVMGNFYKSVRRSRDATSVGVLNAFECVF